MRHQVAAGEIMRELSPINIRQEQNYAAFFLTLACNLHCPYCINLYSADKKPGYANKKSMTPKEWITAADRLVLRGDLPLTLQGGEPTLYKGFYDIVNEVKESIKMDLLTNMSFDVDEFIKKVPVWRFRRDAPYAAIRASYHPGQHDIEGLIGKTMKLQDAGFRIGIYSVLHPGQEKKEHILKVQEKCIKLGIDFRTKEFLGEWNGALYGTYKYEGSVGGKAIGTCECKTTEIIVGPSGDVYRCHADLYSGRDPIGHILDEDFTEADTGLFKECRYYGKCNPCDVKVKTNRFQIFGHTSVEIKNIKGDKVG